MVMILAWMSGMRNWGDNLHGDLLKLVLSNLFGKDRLSFSLVCRHWNAVVATSPYRYSQCFMYYYRRTHTWNFYQYNSFFNVSFPELENADIRCSKHGWLLISRRDDTLFFFDPSNSRKVELPCEIGDVCTSLSFFNPPTSPECMVVGIRTPVQHNVGLLYTIKRGENNWQITEHHIPGGTEFAVSLGAPVLHCGLIYFLGVDGDVAVLDIEQRRLDVSLNCLGPEIDDRDMKEEYLVKVNGEEALFGVFVSEDERKVNVYRLSTSEMKWDLVESIGDKVFYLSHASSFGYKALTKSMENTIYFPKFHGDVAVFYSLSDGKYHSIDGCYLGDNAYGLKRLDSGTWVMPMEVIPTSLSWF